jgi:hypothetical protein
MPDIVQSIQRPEWWFSTILVAVLANIFANYAYDWLRPKMAGRWSTFFRFAVSYFILGILVLCSLLIPMRAEPRFIVISGCFLGFVSSLLEIVGFTKPAMPGRMFFAQLASLFSISLFIFFEPEFWLAWQSKDIVWFASQIFATIMLAFAVSFIFSFIFIRQHLRRQQGLK